MTCLLSIWFRLCMLILKDGGEMYEKLLKDNSGLIVWAAKRYAGACERDSAIDAEDLFQVGFIAIVDASRTFDKSKGTWRDWALGYIRNAMRDALGLHGSRKRAHFGALSLDAPMAEDEDTTLLETLEDTTLPPLDAGIVSDDTRRTIQECVSDLKNDQQREIVRLYKLDGETQAAVAARLGISPQRVGQIWRDSRRALARDQRLRALYDYELKTPYSVHVGVERFNTTRTSATELAAIWRIEHKPTPTPLPD